MIKTYLVVLASDSNLTPSMLAEKVSARGDVDYKETCYGLLLEGEEEKVMKAIDELKSMDPSRVFYKQRGYKIGDSRICRAKRGGGPRPGYHMLSMEREVLKNVSKALESPVVEVKEDEGKRKIAVDKLKKIVESSES